MNSPSQAPALEADETSRNAEPQSHYLLGMIGRVLLVGGGLAVGAVLGLIAGLAFGLIQVSC